MENSRLLLEQGCLIAKYEGMKEEKKMIKQLIDLAIESRDREGFDFLKEKHNELVSKIGNISEEIEDNMEIIEKLMLRKIEKMVNNLTEEDIRRMVKELTFN